jgi:glycosyltransferase involved in cell wall biosynthesis
VNDSAAYVCAFRGSRDSYQTPLALAEDGLLDQFITDAYATPAVRALAQRVSGQTIDKLGLRYVPGIPDDRVRCLWSVSIREQLRHLAGVSPNRTWLQYDPYYSVAAAERARQSRANLLLYSPYAWEAFVAAYPHQPRRVLFQYHPHPDTERRLLESDASRFPGQASSHELDARPQIEHLLRRERDCWQHADLIICSSGFTVRSLTDAGCPAERCVIVPYGVDLPSGEMTSGPDHFHALYVGTGSRRKGLRHLLLAWARASLPKGSRLTIVSRALDPGLEDLAASTPGVELIKGAGAASLSRLYATSSLFVMPSLVEGFGLVYLEALAHGCPVLGTTNTCLPDLGTESDGVFLTPAGDPDALSSVLARLALQLSGNHDIRRAARTTAERYPWSAFRQSLRRVLRDSK